MNSDSARSPEKGPAEDTTAFGPHVLLTFSTFLSREGLIKPALQNFTCLYTWDKSFIFSGESKMSSVSSCSSSSSTLSVGELISLWGEIRRNLQRHPPKCKHNILFSSEIERWQMDAPGRRLVFSVYSLNGTLETAAEPYQLHPCTRLTSVPQL